MSISKLREVQHQPFYQEPADVPCWMQKLPFEHLSLANVGQVRTSDLVGQYPGAADMGFNHRDRSNHMERAYMASQQDACMRNRV